MQNPTSIEPISIEKARRPNILLITADQWRGDCLSAVGHDLGVVTHMCERLAVMRNGAVVERLSSQELAQGAVHEDYTRNLMIASKGFVKA